MALVKLNHVMKTPWSLSDRIFFKSNRFKAIVSFKKQADETDIRSVTCNKHYCYRVYG